MAIQNQDQDIDPAVFEIEDALEIQLAETAANTNDPAVTEMEFCLHALLTARSADKRQ